MDKEHLASLIEQGMSLSMMSKVLGKSQTAIRHWLKKYNLKTKHKAFGDGYEHLNRVSKDGQLCKDCGIKLNDDNANFRKSKGIYYFVCKSCAIKRNDKKRKEFKSKCIEYKGGCCQECGYNKEFTALEFHHKNRQDKEKLISKMSSKSWEVAKIEIDKCDLLCSNCHREEHYRIDERNTVAAEFNKNLLSSLSDVILTGKNTGEESCRRCDTVLTKNNRAAGTKSGICKKCDSKYVMNKMIVGKEQAVEYMGGCCSVCGYDKCIRAIEFHHVDPAKKSPTYNKRFRSWSFERKKKELENCIIVCSNCHREIHADLRLDEPE